MNNKKISDTLDKIAVIYARFSSHNQREESIDAQVCACMDKAKQLGLNVIKVYKDMAKTGTNDDREEFRQMIMDAERAMFKVILIHKLDRFSRDKYDSVIYKRKLKINNVKLISVTENIDDSPESLILESVLEGMAQYYSANLSREVMKGQFETAKQCKHLGGFPPLGYDVDPVTRKYVINEEEAKIVRIIFEQYADGVGYNQILKYLNSRGYTTKSYTNKVGKYRAGNPFAKNSLNSILKNEKYVGTFVFNKKLEKDVTGKRNPQWKSEDEWIKIKGGMPAIINKETFDKVQQKLVENLKSGGRHKAKEIYLLSGLVFCGECGSGMYGNTRFSGRGKTKYSSYRCSNRVQNKGCRNKELRKEYLDNFVLDQLYKNLFSTTSIIKLAKMLSDYASKQALENGTELADVAKELKEVEKKISNVVRLVSEGGISIETIKDNLKELEERKQYLTSYHNELTIKNKTVSISKDTIVDLINRSKEFIQTKNITECRNFITAYVQRVNVYSEHVEILYKINVPGDNNTISALKSEEDIKTLQTEYRAVL